VDKEGHTPLNKATINGDRKMVEMLIARGTKVADVSEGISSILINVKKCKVLTVRFYYD